jgi:hypothetical protein
MHDAYVAKPLVRRQIDQAFPVVQTIAPDLVVERWRAFAAVLIASGDLESPAPLHAEQVEAGADTAAPPAHPRGIMTVQNSRGYIHGLFSYTVEEHLRHGRVLAVENFVVLDLFDQGGAAAELLQAMDELAQSLDCAAIHTNLPDNYSSLPEYCNWVLTRFREAGHAVETLRLCKRRPAEPVPAALPPTANDAE